MELKILRLSDLYKASYEGKAESDGNGVKVEDQSSDSEKIGDILEKESPFLELKVLVVNINPGQNKEFLKEGFTKASLRRIAQKAGITTGALYTRYKNKDELFCSLVSDVCKKFDEQFTYLMPLFYTAIENKSIDKYVQIVHLETQNILSLMYSNYDACILLLNCSKGSSVENWFEQTIQRIITEAQQFYYSFLGDSINKKALELIIVAQFSVYKQVIQNGYSKEEAESCLEVVSQFFDSGWKMIMDDVD